MMPLVCQKLAFLLGIRSHLNNSSSDSMLHAHHYYAHNENLLILLIFIFASYDILIYYSLFNGFFEFPSRK